MAFKENLPRAYRIKTSYVDKYNDLIDRLELCGYNLKEFKVGQENMHREFLGGLTGKPKYSQKVYVERDYLLMQADALLNLFIANSKEEKIGFSLSDDSVR